MSGPANASLDGEGFRWYQWEDASTGEVHRLLSVTSIRKLNGEPYGLVNWQLNNLLDTVMGTVKRGKPGKRVAVLKGQYIYVPDPDGNQFLARLVEADDNMEKLADLRKWTREAADEPRNVAAIRGTITHKAIERGLRTEQVERPWVEATFLDLSQKDRAKRPQGVLDEDVKFVHDAVAQYWDMRKTVPFVIVAREPQVFNLTLGYGGSADQLLWFLPEDYDGSSLPRANDLTLKRIQSIGGYLAVGDVKTAKGVYTDNVVQIHAYGAGEFVGEDGLVNHRLTDILQATQRGVILHVRPDYWGVHLFDFSEPVYRAFAGSVAFARFLATYPKPEPLFIADYSGSAVITSEGE